jgi:hypothetical protein
MVLGHFGGGVVDFRISRPGFDAMTANVNDRSQISFALSRDVMGRVASAGKVQALNSWVAFSEAFPAPPPLLFGTLRGGGVYIDEYRRFQGNSGRYQDGTPYCAVVSITGVLVTTAAPFTLPIGSNDGFIYMAIA